MATTFTIRPVGPADGEQWLRMRQGLWPDYDVAELRREMQAIMEEIPEQAVFVAEGAAGLIGFVEVSLHPRAVGCYYTPIGYIEGWYVDAAHRRAGVGRGLLDAAEQWAASHGCKEMASDTWPVNAESRAAHAAAGYREVEILVHFAKRISTPGG